MAFKDKFTGDYSKDFNVLVELAEDNDYGTDDQKFNHMEEVACLFLNHYGNLSMKEAIDKYSYLCDKSNSWVETIMTINDYIKGVV